MKQALTNIPFQILNWLSYLIPRDKTTMVFIGWHTTKAGEIFTDNTKYLYLHISQQHKDIKAVWLAKNRIMAHTLQEAGLTSYYEKSWRGIWCALRAGTTIVDAYVQRWNFAFLGSTLLVQLLHGKGMKAAGYSVKSRRKQDIICYPSKNVEAMIGDVFSSGSTSYITGYSRSDVILGASINHSEIDVNTDNYNLLKSLRSEGVRIIWYAPTFRRGQTTFDLTAILDLTNLVPLLTKQNLHLCISLHPKYHAHQNAVQHEQISFLQPQDFFPLYQYFDLLITDYSSTFTDYLLLDRPIIFYPYDLDDYIASEGILIDYENETPGPKAYTPTELHCTITSILENDPYQQSRQQALNRYHAYTDTNNSDRIFTAISKNKKIS